MREIGAGGGCMVGMRMDPFTLGYYAVICGLLGYYAPSLGNGGVRLVIGAIVGIAAVSVLPIVRGLV